eukprot:108505-Chlamydomonas_euryale.AAC.1
MTSSTLSGSDGRSRLRARPTEARVRVWQGQGCRRCPSQTGACGYEHARQSHGSGSGRVSVWQVRVWQG